MRWSASCSALPQPYGEPRLVSRVRRIALGYTNRQITEEPGISVRTVETHRANLMDKLGLSSRVELVRYAREHGLI